MSAIFDRHRVIDVDTHVSEPPDVWTSRVASRWGDRNQIHACFWFEEHGARLYGLD